MTETELEKLRTIAENADKESTLTTKCAMDALRRARSTAAEYGVALAFHNLNKGDEDKPLKMLMLFFARLTVSALIEHLKGYPDGVIVEAYGPTGIIGDHIIVEYDDRSKKVTISNKGTELTKELSK